VLVRAMPSLTPMLKNKLFQTHSLQAEHSPKSQQ
jgi:hypothetical protein